MKPVLAVYENMHCFFRIFPADKTHCDAPWIVGAKTEHEASHRTAFYFTIDVPPRVFNTHDELVIPGVTYFAYCCAETRVPVAPEDPECFN
eukprot:1374556-Amorphochlora_amoeboformis.AAC.1